MSAPVTRAKDECPFCHGQLEASVTFDCDITTEGVPERAGTGGSFRVYCANDCGEWPDTGTDLTDWPTAADVADYVLAVVMEVA